MTNRIYYDDPYAINMTTAIVKQQQDESGHWYVVLADTLYYPTGGGQPHDVGTLNEKRVVAVEEIKGEIRHYIEEPFYDDRIEVKVAIDWNRRFDHMQQHAGQHILSAAFEEAFHYETISFHLGKETLTVDLNIEKLSGDEVHKAEAIANAIIQEGRIIETKWISKDDLRLYPLRKAPSVQNDIRLVIIPEFDYNGCGGTHPRSTSEVGSIKILDWEKHKQHIRLEFVCGNRVLDQLEKKHQTLRGLTSLLQAPEPQMNEKVKQLFEKLHDQEKHIGTLQQQLLHDEARDLWYKGSLYTNYKLVKSGYQNRTIQELQKLAIKIVSEHEETLVLFVVQNGQKLQFVVAKGEKVSTNIKGATKRVMPLINGKGGGKDTFIQGGGEAIISVSQLLDQLEEEILA
ncbi:alanyl-tRNA editing protein [Bacillus sp. 2205SS5-2]|uniref:alanyl-tRNA editing protein n=1 Tax=Bacillus sp. 2205SS5-2 TaxID=3109031 RepID=UPI00300788C2